MSDENRLTQEEIDETVEKFRTQYTEAANLSVNPRELKWAVFPTGDTKIEYAAATAIIRNLMLNLHAFHFYHDRFDRNTVIKELEQHLKELKDEKPEMKTIEANAQQNDFRLVTGV